MANGSFKNYMRGSSESNYFGLYCEYTYAQNVSGNYTDITVDVWIRYYSLDTIAQSGTVTVNGTSKSFTSPAISNYPSGGGGKTKLTSQTIRVAHNSDGTKTGVGISVSWNCALTYAGTYYSSLSASTTVNLPTIPRASSITSAGNVTLGNACSVKWTPASSSFKYKLTFSLGSWSATTGFISPGTTSAYTYTGYTIPNNETLLKQIPNSTTEAMSVKLATYNSSGTQIGSTSAAKTFTVTVPSTVKPTVGTMTLNPADINGQNILVQGKNTITVSVSTCSAGLGSSIKSYTFSGPGISYTGDKPSATSGIISNTGTLTYTVTVTDNRGRSTSKSANITCYAYSAPYFTSFNAYRVGSSTSTTANDSGTYIRYAYNIAFSSVNGTNDVTVTLKYKTSTGSFTPVASDLTNSKSTSGSKIIGTFDAATTYVVCAEITDNYSGTSVASSSQITIFSAARTINVKPDGKGVAFGKMAETSNLLDVAWPLKVGGAIDTDKPEQTMKNLSYKGSNVISSTASDTTANWGNLGNLATVFYSQTGKITNQPSQYGFVLNLTNGPNAAEVHQLWATQSSGSLLHRGGNSSGWNGSWRTILDSSNYTTYTGSYAAKPVTLYSTTSGNIGTITLSSSAANFAYLEIFYTDNNGRQANSVRVHAPNGKHVTLSCIEPSTSSSEPRLYIRSSGWTISGTSMTVGRSDLSGANRGVYGQLYPNANGTNSDAKVTENNYIKIFRVVGYN